MTKTEAAALLNSSPTLKVAFDYTVEFCARERITDPALMATLLDRAVREIHANLLRDLEADRDAIRERILHRVWTEVRTEAGLPV